MVTPLIFLSHCLSNESAVRLGQTLHLRNGRFFLYCGDDWHKSVAVWQVVNLFVRFGDSSAWLLCSTILSIRVLKQWYTCSMEWTMCTGCCRVMVNIINADVMNTPMFSACGQTVPTLSKWAMAELARSADEPSTRSYETDNPSL